MAGMFDNPGPFDPFFDDVVCIEGVRDGRTVCETVPACVMDQGFDDPLTDVSTETNRRKVEVTVRRSDWREILPPQTCDVVRLDDGGEFEVFAVVASHASEWILRARSKA